MGLPETLLIVLGAALIMALVLGLLLRSMLHGRADPHGDIAVADLEAAKEANADLRRKLAVEEHRSSRLVTVEDSLAESQSTLEEVRSGKAAVEAQLAASRQEAVGLRSTETDLRQRLTALETALASANAETEAAHKAKAEVDETLAGRTASLELTETGLSELKQRLEEAGLQQRELSNRFEKLRDEKATVDESVSAKAEALRIGEEQAFELRTRLDAVIRQFGEATAEVLSLKTAHATLRETLDQERKQADEKLALLVQARAAMGMEFKSLAEEVMARHGESFTKLNKEQIEGILTPLREKLGEFEQKVQAAHVESVKERATLAEQIRNIAATGAAMGKETKELTEALRGRSQTQGAWGEMVLGTILERSGLRVNEEYTVQQSFADDEGRRLRPDVIVNMPGGQRMVVDAKVSLTAFEALVHAASDDERGSHLQRHLASVRGHIATFGSNEYHNAAGTTLDYVVMFVPIEGALAAALQAEPNLILFAAERNVAITTPTTLMVALRTIANVWQVERRNQNAEEIANRAGKLYEKFVGFIEDMGAIDEGIKKTRNSYDKAINKLKTGNGNLVRQVEQLKTMGGRTSKVLPPSLLEAAEGQVTLALTTQTTETEVTVETTTQLVMTAPAADTADGRAERVDEE